MLDHFLAQKLAEFRAGEILRAAEGRRLVRQAVRAQERELGFGARWAWRVGGLGAVGLVAWGLIAAFKGAG